MCFGVFPHIDGKERGPGFRRSRTVAVAVAVVLAEDVPGVQSSFGPPRRSGNYRKTRKHDLSHAVVQMSLSIRSYPFVVMVLLGVGACDASPRLGDPAAMDVAPDSFPVEFTTSAGTVEITFYRAWSPIAVDRAYQLAQNRFWDGARIYRVSEVYAQFGYSGRPELDSLWVPAAIPDEPVVESNVRGTVSFARGGVGTRSTILFINRMDNSNLDDLAWNGVLGFPPVGRISQGMDVVDRLYAGYGDEPMQWEDSISAVGNPFLDRAYPNLDSIKVVRLLDGEG